VRLTTGICKAISQRGQQPRGALTEPLQRPGGQGSLRASLQAIMSARWSTASASGTPMVTVLDLGGGWLPAT
jgi:hypothetical protein